VLSERSKLSSHLRQLILNPLKGHPQAARSLHNPDFLETLRELAAVVSALSGTVSVYDGGETVLELKRAQPGS
jgi:hypothetical protein